MIPATAFVVVALASYRATRLVTEDVITQPFRDGLYRFAWDDAHPTEGDDGKWYPTARAGWRTWLHTLLTCPWCFGVWVSAVFYSAWRWVDVPAVRAVMVVLAIAGVQGFIASRKDA